MINKTSSNGMCEWRAMRGWLDENPRREHTHTHPSRLDVPLGGMHVHIHVRMMMMMMIDGRQTQDLELIVRSCGSSEVHLRKHYCPRGLVIIVTIEAESDDDPAMASSGRSVHV
jgi:hypothetical protein